NVKEFNVIVQISKLRGILEKGRSLGSVIQNLRGKDKKGYKFVARLKRDTDRGDASELDGLPDKPSIAVLQQEGAVEAAEPPRVERRLAAILAADVAGYSRLVEDDEEGTLGRLKALRRELVDPKIAKHHGRIVKTTGDGLLVEFASVVD